MFIKKKQKQKNRVDSAVHENVIKNEFKRDINDINYLTYYFKRMKAEIDIFQKLISVLSKKYVNKLYNILNKQWVNCSNICCYAVPHFTLNMMFMKLIDFYYILLVNCFYHLLLY